MKVFFHLVAMKYVRHIKDCFYTNAQKYKFKGNAIYFILKIKHNI